MKDGRIVQPLSGEPAWETLTGQLFPPSDVRRGAVSISLSEGGCQVNQHGHEIDHGWCLSAPCTAPPSPRGAGVLLDLTGVRSDAAQMIGADRVERNEESVLWYVVRLSDLTEVQQSMFFSEWESSCVGIGCQEPLKLARGVPPEELFLLYDGGSQADLTASDWRLYQTGPVTRCDPGG